MKNNRKDSTNCNNVHNTTANNRKRCAAPTNKRLHKKHKNCSLNSLTPAVGSIVSFPCITRFMPSRSHFVQQLICKPSRCFFREQHTVDSAQTHCHYHSKSSATNKMCIARQDRITSHKHIEHATQHSTAALISLVKEYENIVHKVQVSELRELLAPLKETALRLNKLARASQLEEPCYCRCRYKPDLRNISLDFSDMDCNEYSERNKFKDTWLCKCVPNQLNISRNDKNLHISGVIDNEEDINFKKTRYCQCHAFGAVASTYGGAISPVEMLDSEAAQTLRQGRDANQQIISSALNNEICPMCGRHIQGDETVNHKVDANIEEKRRDEPDIPGIVLSSLDDCPNYIEGKDSCDDCGCLTSTDERMEKSTTVAQSGDNLEHNQQALRRNRDASTSIDENYYLTLMNLRNAAAATDPACGLCGAIFNGNSNIRTECQQTSILSNSATILDDKFSMSVTANVVETITSGDNIITTQQHITVLASNLQEKAISSTDEYTDEYASASASSLLEETQQRSTSCNWDCVAVCKESVSCENLKIELSEDDLGKLCTCGCGYYQGEIDEICSCNCADSVNSEINECDPMICSPTKNFNGDGTNRSFNINNNVSNLQETIELIKKENDYLTKLMKRCKCVEDDVKNLSESPPIRYTYSGLLSTVEVLKSKCRSKDEMITVLAEGLRGSQNIEQIAKNLTESCTKYSSMDFDHRGLYAYLCATKANEQENINEYSITADEDDSNFAIPAPTEFTIVRDICNCFLVSWKMEDISNVKGYQIFINGQIDTHVRTSTRTEAVLGFHDTTKPIELTLYAVGKGDRLSDPVKLTYNQICNYIE